VVNFRPRPLYSEERAPGTHWRLGEHQRRSGRGDEEINSHFLPGLEPPIIQPVAQRYTAKLTRLLPNVVIPIVNCCRVPSFFELS
jgi:hypothetical protein